MKILIIGQAPSAQKQELPYDTTLLYEMFSWVGISKEESQILCDFDAVSNIFPGSKDGSHLRPKKSDMDAHWENQLEDKVIMAEKVLLLGAVARDYFYSKPKRYSCNLEIYEMIHPSRRNYARIMAQKENIIQTLNKLFKN